MKEKAFLIKSVDVVDDQPITVRVDTNGDLGGVGVTYITGDYDTPEAINKGINELNAAKGRGERLADFWDLFTVTPEGARALALILNKAADHLEEVA